MYESPHGVSRNGGFSLTCESTVDIDSTYREYVIPSRLLILPLDRLPKKSILCVVGARPNFVKIAPIISALREPPVGLPACLIHTGQHYDVAMNKAFFRELEIPEPDVDLEVGSASHAVQTAQVMQRFEPIVEATDPAAVLVVGDVNSTIACALVASKRGVLVFHVEAGLRSFDRRMPE